MPLEAKATEPLPGGTIIILGDSLSAGYQLLPEFAWPALVQSYLDRDEHPYSIINAGISGDTTDGGLSRLPGLLDKYQPVLVMVALGANDGLRGQSIKKIKQNLRSIIEQIEAAGAKVFLLGMRIPPNFGPLYSDRFAALYAQLQEELSLPWMPFLLQTIADQPDYFLADGLHPNSVGQELVAREVYQVFRSQHILCCPAAK